LKHNIHVAIFEFKDRFREKNQFTFFNRIGSQMSSIVAKYYFKTNIYKMHITIEYATPLPGSAYEILKKEVAKYPYNFEVIRIREKQSIRFCGLETCHF
jgi:hypothetical protein